MDFNSLMRASCIKEDSDSSKKCHCVHLLELKWNRKLFCLRGLELTEDIGLLFENLRMLDSPRVGGGLEVSVTRRLEARGIGGNVKHLRLERVKQQTFLKVSCCQMALYGTQLDVADLG
jgi:hypothetical protein